MKKTYVTPKVRTIKVYASDVMAGSATIGYSSKAADNNHEVLSKGNQDNDWDD